MIACLCRLYELIQLAAFDFNVEDRAVRKRLIASVFITFLLCAPTLAGHVLIGGGWCACGPEYCVCDPGETPGGNRATVPDDSKPSDLGAGSLFVLAALFLVLRYKA